MFRKTANHFISALQSNLLQGNGTLQLVNGVPKRFIARKRFYRKTNVLYSGQKYEVTLDQRKLKTPNGSVFYTESEPLALAIAAEWDAQKTHIQPSTMHLTGLTSTVLDNPAKLTKYDIASEIVGRLESDTILFSSNEDDELYELQMREWKPVIDWFCDRFGVNIEASRQISGPTISIDSKEIVKKHLLSHNIWAVFGYRFAVESLNSVILGLSCAERLISVEKAVLLSRLEEEFQSKRWGRVEWAHEISQQDTQARVAAAVLFIHFNSSSSKTKIKDVSP